MEREICRHFMYGYCKFKENCMKQHVKVECKDLSACKSKECLKRHPKVCKRFFAEKFCKFKAGCAYLHSVDQSSQVQQQKDIQNELKIKLLEGEVIVLKSQIIQLGVMTRDLTDKVELVIRKQVPENNVAEKPKQAKERKIKEKDIVVLKVTEVQNYKCNQCNSTFKKDVTLQKHKNTKHGQIQKELGEGRFGFAFDVRPGKEKEAKLLRNYWRKDQKQKPSYSSSLSSIDREDNDDDSEDDEAFLAKYDDDGNFIG